ncbi:MAG: hypothetical protein H0W90_01930 [Actinobacteria bacterium]|nr:hypothetical protein [Actinomycetota bacterium]
MYGLTRATTTLVFSAVAGLLIWFATQISNDQIGGYWARVGLVAGAGFLMALSQLLGGWTKWGWPRLSLAVFITAFIPVAIVSLWVVLAGEPGSGWFHNHVMAWTRDIHVSGLVTDFLYYIPVLAFGTGLVFGFSFDTTGPRVRDREVVVDRDREVVQDDSRRGWFSRRRTDTPTTTSDGPAADEPLTADREATTTSTTDSTTERETV